MAINVRMEAGRGIILLKTVNSSKKEPSCDYDTDRKTLEQEALNIMLCSSLLCMHYSYPCMMVAQNSPKIAF